MIDLPERDLDEVKRILAEQVPECEVRAFGSRVDGGSREFSDLDLALVGAGRLGWRRIEILKDAFAASDLAVAIDVVDWHAISPEFRAVIERSFVVVRQPSPPS